MSDAFSEEPIRPWDEYAFRLATSPDPLYPSPVVCTAIGACSADQKESGGGPSTMAERYEMLQVGSLRDPADCLPHVPASEGYTDRATDWRRELLARRMLFGDLIDEAEDADCLLAVLAIWDRYGNDEKTIAAEVARDCIRVTKLSAQVANVEQLRAETIRFLKGRER